MQYANHAHEVKNKLSRKKGKLCGASHFVKGGAPRGKSMVYIASKLSVKIFEIRSSIGNLEVEEIRGVRNHA